MGPAPMEDVVLEPCVMDTLDDSVEAGVSMLVSAAEVLASDVDCCMELLPCMAEDVDCCMLLLLCVAEDVIEDVVFVE